MKGGGFTNKYKHLAKNTVIFAIGTFSSKVLTFVLVPVYTYSMATEDYGQFNLLVQTCNLLLPIITVGMTQAIIRFGVDRLYNKKDVFTVAVSCTLACFIIFAAFTPLMRLISFIGGYVFLLLAYVFMMCLRQICNQFVRARGYSKLFAIDGTISTFTNCIFTIFFVAVFRLGIFGAMLSIIMSDCLSVIFLTWGADLWKFIRFKGINKGTFKSMIRFAAPLIPTEVLWWIVSVSDLYLVAFMLGESENGIYSVSYKVPTILMVVASIFMNAWQVSAVEENNQHRAEFFSRVFNLYQVIMLFAASILIPLAKVFTIILTSDAYYTSWKYIPVLIMATAFCNMVSFTASIYMLEKRSVAALVTSVLGAATNVVLNLILIPTVGIMGAAIATFFSYFIVFVVRMVHTRQFIKIRINILRFAVNMILLIAQTIIMVLAVPGWIFIEIGIVILFTILNIKPLKQNVMGMLRRG